VLAVGIGRTVLGITWLQTPCHHCSPGIFPRSADARRHQPAGWAFLLALLWCWAFLLAAWLNKWSDWSGL
jgi:hypothetical protein